MAFFSYTMWMSSLVSGSEENLSPKLKELLGTLEVVVAPPNSENFDVIEPVGMLMGKEPRSEKFVETFTLKAGGPPKTEAFPKEEDVKDEVFEVPLKSEAVVVVVVDVLPKSVGVLPAESPNRDLAALEKKPAVGVTGSVLGVGVVESA